MKYDSFEIAMLIKEVYANTVGVISESLKDSDLTYQQGMVIKLIAHNGQVNISKICDEMSLSKGTVSGIVTRLEALGYIKKIKDENDKRNTYVTFSDKGLKFARQFRNTINESFDKVFENFSQEELSEFRSNLINVRNKIKK